MNHIEVSEDTTGSDAPPQVIHSVMLRKDPWYDNNTLSYHFVTISFTQLYGNISQRKYHQVIEDNKLNMNTKKKTTTKKKKKRKKGKEKEEQHYLKRM